MTTIRGFFIIVISILITNSIYGQWTQVNTNISFDIKEIQFKDSLNGILTSDSGVYITTNGGSIWQPISSFNTSNDALVYARTKFSGVYYYPSYYRYYAAGTDTVNHKAILFSCPDNSPVFQVIYTGQPNTNFNTIGRRVAIGDNGYMVQISGVTNASKLNYYVPGDLIDLSSPSLNYSTLVICGTNSIFTIQPAYTGYTDISGPFVSKGVACISATSAKYVAINSHHIYMRGNTFPWKEITAIDNPDTINSIGNMTWHIFNKYVFLGTDNGIFKSSSNGEVYEFQPSSTGKSILCFAEYGNYGNGFAGGKNGVLLKTSNFGGATVPVAKFTNPSGVCLGDSSHFEAQYASSYSYIWKVNNVQVSTASSFSTIFNTPGTYILSLTVNNGSNTNTISDTVYVTNKPLTNIGYSISDTLICKSGNATISLDSSENNVKYKLVSLKNGAVVNQVYGTGGSVNLQTGIISDSLNLFTIIAENIYSHCSNIFNDTIKIGVEKTKSKFYISNLNAELNETIRLFNKSEICDSVFWHFGNGASLSTSNSDSIVDILYSITGNKQIMQIVKTNYGCIDTSYGAGLFIYSPDSNYHRQWAMNINSNNTSSTNYPLFPATVFVDDENNVYYGGVSADAEIVSYKGNVPDTISYGYEAFISKYDRNGILKWNIISEKGKSSCRITKILPGPDGGIYIIGRDNSSQISGNSLTLISTNGEKHSFYPHIGFIMKVNKYGVIQWVAKEPACLDATLDNAGNLYLYGKIFSSVNSLSWHSVSGSLITRSFSGYNHYIAKLNNQGEFVWVNLVNSSSDNHFDIGGIGADYYGNVYVSGYHNEDLTIESIGQSSTNISISGLQQNVYLIKYNTNGTLQWAIDNFNFTANDNVKSLDVDSMGNIYFTGNVYNNYNGSQAVFVSVNQPSDTIDIGGYYICKYNSSGNLQWANGEQYSYSSTKPSGIKVDKKGNVFVCGRINQSQTITFTSTDSNFLVIPNSPTQTFFLKYDSTGVLEKFTTESGESTKNYVLNKFELGNLDVDVDGNLYFSGTTSSYNTGFADSIQIIVNDTLRPKGKNIFIAKMGYDLMEYKDLEVEHDSIFCSGSSYSIPFKVFPDFNIFNNNVYKIELSNKYGLFTNSQVIGTLNSSNHIDTVIVTIPPNLESSINYRFRLIASAPKIESEEIGVIIKNTPQSFTLDTMICPSNSITLTATQATNYSWIPSPLFQNPLQQSQTVSPSVNLTVYASATNICGSAIDTFNIILYPMKEDSLPKDTFACKNSIINLPLNPNLSYYWNNYSNIVNSSPTNVEFFVDHNLNLPFLIVDSSTQCLRNDTLMITALNIPTLNISPSSQQICKKDTVQLSVQSGGYSFVWINPYNMLNATTLTPHVFPNTDTAYIIQATDTLTQCKNSDTAYITVLDLPNVNIQFDGQNIYVAQGSLFYQWLRNDSILTNENFYFLKPTILQAKYNVYVINQNNCDATSDDFIFTSINPEQTEIFDFNIYPNPVKDKLTLTFFSEENGVYYLEIVDEYGAIVHKKTISARRGDNKFEIELSNLRLSQSVYIFRLYSNRKSADKSLIIIK